MEFGSYSAINETIEKCVGGAAPVLLKLYPKVGVDSEKYSLNTLPEIQTLPFKHLPELLNIYPNFQALTQPFKHLPKLLSQSKNSRSPPTYHPDILLLLSRSRPSSTSPTASRPRWMRVSSMRTGSSNCHCARSWSPSARRSWPPTNGPRDRRCWRTTSSSAPSATPYLKSTRFDFRLKQCRN